MKHVMVFSTVLLFSSLALAAGKTYQATGSVVEMSDNVIVVDKGKDGKWEIARDANTKIIGDLQKGAKVTVVYRMVATSVEVKGGEKKADKPAKK